MIYNSRNRSNHTTESQKEKITVLMPCRRKVKLECPMYSKQINKMWSLKGLVMLKCKRRVELVYLQHSVSASQALF